MHANGAKEPPPAILSSNISAMGLFVFGFQLGWFPTSGSVTPGTEPGTFAYFLSKLNHLLLPALSMALITTVSTVQYLRSEIIDTKQKDFIVTARAKGNSETRVYNRHILRNSLLPIAAVIWPVR